MAAYESIVDALRYAGGHELPVVVTLRDGREIAGVPTSVDTHPTANEVYLSPLASPDTEMAISLAAITAVVLS